MSGFSDPVVGGGGNLVYPSIQSPNFVAGVSGWQISKSGSAQFNNLTLQGTFYGLDFIISPAGIFFYRGTPAAGSLVGSWTPSPGADPFGNTIGAPGLQIGAASGPKAALMSSGQAATLEFLLNTADAVLAPAVTGQVISAGAAAQLLQLLLQGPRGTGGNANAFAVTLSSDSDDGTIPAALAITDLSGILYLYAQNTAAQGPQMSIGTASGPVAITVYGTLLSYGAASGGVFTKTYTTPGSGTIPIPAGVLTAHVECLASAAGGQYAAGPGGGSGEYAAETALAVTTAGIAYTIGAGGAAGTSGSHAGGAGADVTAAGTSVTVHAHGAPANNNVGTPSSSSGGSGSTNSVHRNGSGSSGWNGAAQGGGGGAGAPSATAAGGAGTGPSNTVPGNGGSGGAGGFGAGGGGGGWGSSSSNANTTGGGNGGIGAGGGAGGAGPAAGSGATGGFGGGGAIRVTYTLPGTQSIVASRSAAAGTDINGLPYPAGFGGINIPVITQTSATQQFTLASAVLITGLSVALVPGTYAVEIDVEWVPSGVVGSTHQHYVAFSGTVSASAWNTIIWQAEAADAVQQTLGFQVGTAFPIAGQASPAHVALNGWTTIKGRMVVTAAGTLATGIVLGVAGDDITTQIASMMTVTRTA